MSSSTGGITGRGSGGGGGGDINDQSEDEGYEIDQKRLRDSSKRYSWKGNLASLKRELSLSTAFSGPLGRDRRSRNGSRWDRFVIRPDNWWYVLWTYFILLWAVYSSFFTPLEFGFFRGLPEDLFLLDIAGQFAFLIDIVVRFFVAYRDTHSYCMIYDRSLIALRYLKSRFLVDLLGCFPWDAIFKDLTTGRMIGSAKETDGLYYFEDGPNSSRQCQNTCLNSISVSKENDILIWHYRLGHPRFLYLKYLFPNLFWNKSPTSFQCEVCQFAKHHRASFSTQPYKPTTPFTVIHSDIWGPCRTSTHSGKKWFVTFIDDHTRLSWVYLMTEKSEVATIFKTFYTMVHTQFQKNIQILRSDNGREYFKNILGQFFLEKGIVHQSSCVDTPQQNGVAERKNKHLLEVARALLFTSQVPKYLWGEAVLTATYLINRTPNKVLSFATPFDIFHKCYPTNRLSSSLPLKIFGCTAFVHIHNQGKLEPRATKCVFVGYAPTQKGYKCFDPTSKKLFVTMDVTFFELLPYFKPHLQGGNQNKDSAEGFHDFFQTENLKNDPSPTLIIQPENPSFIIPGENESSCLDTGKAGLPTVPSHDVHKGETEMENTALVPFDIVYSRQKTTRKKESFNPSHCPESVNPPGNVLTEPLPHVQPMSSSSSELESGSNPEFDDSELPIAVRKGVRSCTQHPLSNYVSYENLSPVFRAFTSQLSCMEIPNTVQDALKIPEWKEAVFEEMKALEKNGTWELVDLPRGKTTVGSKWVFTVKYKSDGSLERYKARLVAKGFTQTYGIDYLETFAPVAKLNTVRVLLSLAANCDWPLQQLDVKNAFLNGDLEEEVYMDAPPGFGENFGTKVCKLKKSLYGLKQSPRAWFEKFTQFVKSQGYTQAQSDHTMFARHSQDGKKTILIVYVDDIILTGDDALEMNRLKTSLSSTFEIKDLGSLRYFLGMEVARSKKGIVVSQRKYVLDLLTETGMSGCRPADTPIVPNRKLGDNKEGDPVNTTRYQKLVGKLIYLSHTRPDIAFAASGRKEVVRYLLWIRLSRALRVTEFFEKLEKNIRINYLGTRIVKLFVVELYCTHTAACIFYYLATTVPQAEEGYTWIGSLKLGDYSYSHFREIDLWKRYVTSLYFAIVTMATVGYGEIHAVNVREMIFIMFYVSFDMILGAYLLGNMAALIVKGSKTEKFRDKMADLIKYMNKNNLDRNISKEIKGHLRLQYDRSTTEVGLLQDVPSSIRTKIAQNLYEPYVKEASVFKGCSSGFIKQIASRVHEEFFLPGEVIVEQGNVMDQLYVICYGEVEELGKVEDDETEESHKRLQAYSSVGEVSFLCNNRQPCTVRARELCKVLRLDKQCFIEILEIGFPDGRIILSNLLEGKDSNLQRKILDSDVTLYIEQRESELAMRVNCAAYDGDSYRLKRLISAGADPNKTDYDGRSPLHIAASKGYEDIARFLIEQKVLINILDKFGNSPLLEAIKNGQDQVASLLVKAGAELTIDDAGGFLCTTIARRDFDLLKRVLANGINPNSKNYDRRTPLHMAASEGLYSVAELLIEAGASVLSKDRWGSTPFDDACINGDKNLIKLLEVARTSQLSELSDGAQASRDELRQKKCTVFPFHPWDPKQERKEGVVLWVPQSIHDLIKAARELLKCSSGSCILSENGGKILDISMVTDDQKLYLVGEAQNG